MAQVLPVRLYGDSMDEQAHALVQASDTGFCVAGWTRSYGSGTPNASNILIVKTDRQGIPVWARMSVGEHDDEAYSMVRTSDAGYAITGWTRSYGLSSPTSDIFVVKLTANGVQQWARAFGGVADDQAYSIIQTADGGYAVCGWTMSFGAMPAPNIFVLRLNPAGLVQWMRSYWLAPTHMHDEGYSIVQTADGGYAVCGRAHATNPLAFDAFVMKLNSFGNVQWAMIVPGDSADEASSVALDASGNIMVAGWTKSFGTAPFAKADAFAARFSPAGLISWSQTYGWPDDDEQVLDDRSLTRTADGNLALCALTRSRGPAGSGDNFMVMKASGATGLPLWTVSHPSSDDPGMLSDVPLPMIEMTDRSFAVAGWTNSWPSKLGGMDFMLSTFDSLGARPHCSHPEDIETDGMPWRTQEVMEELCMPLVDSFELTRVDVRLDSACFSGTGLEQGTRQLAPEPGIALRCRNGRALLTLPAPAAVHIQVFCVDGRQVADLGSRDLNAGTHEILLPSGCAAGVNLVRATAGSWSLCAKSLGF
ncbi:MAG: hypothetical protein ABIK37_01065 [candidate division WOR-3 bacterium]